jgi:transposase-like protein
MLHDRRRSSQREQFWRETLAAWEKSGQSIRAFCASRGLSKPSFYAWRRTLRERDRRRPAARRGPTLVPLRVVPGAVLEVVLPAGVVVRVPAGADAAAVATLVAALGSASC